MDLLRQLGMLPLASRLKRLTERLYRSGEHVYAGQGVDFEPRWFQVIARLKMADGDSLTITSIARDLRVTHPAVIKVVREMEQRGIVVSTHDPTDARKRRVRLTAAGKRLVGRLEPIWAAFEHVTGALFDEIGCDVIAVIDRLESALDREDMTARVTACLEHRPAPLEIIERRPAAVEIVERRPAAVEIIEHRPALAGHFHRLNDDLLREDLGIEVDGGERLHRPDTEIINRGGVILYTRVAGRIVGTLALVRLSARRFELATIAVEKGERGKGLGSVLLSAGIERARELGARTLVLETHAAHSAALHLYRKHGFERKPVRIPGRRRVRRRAGGFSMALDLRTGP
jgi:DNA-binding MarR family transcriptional regulator/GNAT superfamily N-acetyltransferase